MQEIDKVGKKYIRKKNVFFDSTLFTNFSLESVVKNFPEDKFKCLSQEFKGNQLELVK